MLAVPEGWTNNQPNGNQVRNQNGIHGATADNRDLELHEIPRWRDWGFLVHCRCSKRFLKQSGPLTAKSTWALLATLLLYKMSAECRETKQTYYWHCMRILSYAELVYDITVWTITGREDDVEVRAEQFLKIPLHRRYLHTLDTT